MNDSSSLSETRRIETLLAHAGCEVDETTGAVTPPLHLSTTFERDRDGGYSREFVYARWANPTRSVLEKTLAELEGGVRACTFSSGMAAITTVFRALSSGDHVLLPDDVYHATRHLLRDLLADWGIVHTSVDMTDQVALSRAIRPTTRLVWVETPSNPQLRIIDIEAVVDIAHKHGAIVVADGTWTTPLLQRPLDLGADLVVHSLTKYMSGHSDVLAGAVVAREDSEFFARIMTLQRVGGAVASPFDCWLTLRGLRSLAARMRVHCDNAQRLADFLDGQRLVEAVHYPGLKSHPGYKIARQQMTDFGGMLAFEVDGGRDAALEIAARCRVFTRATSLGGTESLIEHRESIESKPTATPPGLLRVSVGLEHVEDLIADLKQALDS